MRIALLQAVATPLDPEANLAALREAAVAAREGGAELILTPELFLSGYAPRELADWLTPERVSEIPAAAAAIARETGIAVAASFPLARQDGSFAIAAELWDAAGASVLRYEKVHLWGDVEPLGFSPSTEVPQLAEWNGRRVGFQICYDIEFPEPARSLAARGVDLLLVPTAIDGHSDYVPELLVRARAAENAMVVAYADHAGQPVRSGDPVSADPAADFTGKSTVAGREGRVLAVAGRTAELLFADLPEVAPVAAGQADYLSDRRPDLYADWR